MPQYAILRFSKHKGGSAGGLEAHHERTKEQYASNPDIDPGRTRHNYHTVQPQGRYKNEIDNRITAAGCKTRKDSTRFVDTLITASPEFFKGKKLAEVKAFFEQATTFIAQRVDRQNIVSAVVHLDEKTPHMHLTFVPLTTDNRLSAKEILGNRADLSKWQDDFFAHMVKHFPGLERGEPSRETGRRHIPMRVFKQAVHLTKQAQRIETLLADIGPLNAKKNRDEVLALLTKWFPAMEDFQGQLNKYRGTIDYLQKENAVINKRADDNWESKIQNRLKIGKLQSEVRDLRRVYDLVPEDLKQEMQAALKQDDRQKRRER